MINKQLLKYLPIENAKENFPVEWWFFNGSFSNKTIGQRDFMISFFRHNMSEKKEKTRNGYSLLFSLLNPDTNSNETYSLIDNIVFDDTIKVLKSGEESDLDKDLIKVLIKEFTRHGPPRPIELGSAKTVFNNSKLSIEWDKYSVIQTNKYFTLNFPFDKKRNCNLTLIPETPLYELLDPKENTKLEGEMAYYCYPRLSITGYIGKQKITGKAWFDHQWGDGSWGISKGKNKKILGWDWFGINLANGFTLAIIIHNYVRENKKIISHAVLIDPKGKRKHTNNFTAVPTEYWESPITHIKYPVKWKINIPEFSILVTFTPTSEDQEIHVFGMARAIWEGAGIVTGKMNGRQISGRARGEFYGYGFIFDFQNYLQDLANRVDKRIEEFFPKQISKKTLQKFVGRPKWRHEPSAYTEMLSVPIWDLILRRGKRWRPIFGILMGEALGKSSEHYEASACLAELVHSGALIIDDIEDDSKLRRGEKTLHLKYGLDVALNAGNTLYFLPYVDLLQHKFLTDQQKLRIHEIWMKTYLEAHFGQTLDIYWSKNMNKKNLSKWLNDSLDFKILQMYDYKTAAGAKGLAEVAAVIAEVDDNLKNTAVSFARAFAVSFQIIDDVHNFSNSPKWTKERGEDLKNGKLTYVIAKSIKLLSKKNSLRLQSILCSPELRNDNEILSEGIELINSSGSLEICREEAKKMSMKEWNKFSKSVPSCEPKIMLNMLCLKMLDLAYDT